MCKYQIHWYLVQTVSPNLSFTPQLLLLLNKIFTFNLLETGIEFAVNCILV